MSQIRLFLLGILLVAPLLAEAQEPFVPLGMPHQGRLLSDDNQPVHGLRKFTFRLYRSALAGQPVWEETLSVPVEEGFYSVVLGDPSATPARPMGPEVFAGPLHLGISVDTTPELLPRLRVATVPYAHRAQLADSMQGGTITGATITGSDIEATEIRVGSRLVVDSSGRLAGLAEQLNSEQVRGYDSERLGNRPASDYVTQELLEDYPTRAQLASHDERNWLANSSFEIGVEGALPRFWENVGNANASTHADARLGSRALRVNDTDGGSLLGVRQVVLSAAGAAQAVGQRFTASAHSKKLSGSSGSVARLCLEESDTARSCATFAGDASYVSTEISHTLSRDATRLALVLYTGQQAADTGDFLFDAVMLSPGDSSAPWRPHVTEQLYEGGIPASKLVHGAGSGLDADLFDGRDSSHFVAATTLSTPGSINAAANPVDWSRLKNVPAKLSGSVINADQLGGHAPDHFAVASALSTPGTLNAAANPVDWTRLKNVPAGFADGVDGDAPVGSVVGWLKSFAGTPALPAGWVECNGQVLSDGASPYNGRTLPNLNSANRFLRGNTVSGGTGGSVSHTHTFTQVSWDSAPDASRDTSGSITDAANHLPPYFDVVWVMKVR